MAVEPEVRRMGLAPKDAISRESGGMSRTGPVSGRTYARARAAAAMKVVKREEERKRKVAATLPWEPVIVSHPDRRNRGRPHTSAISRAVTQQSCRL